MAYRIHGCFGRIRWNARVGSKEMRYRQNALAAQAEAPLLGTGLEELLADVGVRLGDAVRVQQADGVPRVRAQAPGEIRTRRRQMLKHINSYSP